MGDVSETAPGALTATWAEARGRLERFDAWRRRLVEELVELPDTMQRLRHGAANFELVGERLAKSSASLEEVADWYQSTVAESGRRSAQAVDEMRAQVEALAGAAGSPERLAETVSDMQKAFETMAELNPFWPRSTRKR